MQGSATANGHPQRVALSQPIGRSASRAKTSGVGLSCFCTTCEALLSHPVVFVWQTCLGRYLCMKSRSTEWP